CARTLRRTGEGTGKVVRGIPRAGGTNPGGELRVLSPSDGSGDAASVSGRCAGKVECLQKRYAPAIGEYRRKRSGAGHPGAWGGWNEDRNGRLRPLFATGGPSSGVRRRTGGGRQVYVRARSESLGWRLLL